MGTAGVAPDRHDGREAARRLLADDVDVTVGDDVRGVLASVGAGDLDAAVVPFEDSEDGTCVPTVDTMVFDVADLVVTAEVDLDRDGRTTRWVRVARAADTGPVGADGPVQSLFFAVPHLNRPGVLAEMVAAFSSRGINVGRFEPRPLQAGLGMYGFLLEVDGHPGQPWVAEALADLLAATSAVVHLGTLATGERAWSTVSGRGPAGRRLRDRGDLAVLVSAWTSPS